MAIALAALLWVVANQQATPIHVADVTSFEGDRVVVSGWPKDIAAGDGWARFTLVEDGFGVVVWHDEPPPTDFVRVTGTLTRLDGRLILDAESVEWISSS